MPDLEPMVLMHLDGTEVHFVGARLPDDPPYINRVMFKPNTYNPKDNPLPVCIWFDDLKRHQYWGCSCGGTTLPFHLCKHLQTLEISTTNTGFFMTLKEYQYIISTPLEAINFNELGDELAGQVIKHFPAMFGDKQEEALPPEKSPFVCDSFTTFFGGLFCQDCGHLEGEHIDYGNKSFRDTTFGDWDVKQKPAIPATKMRRIFADKDEDV